MVVDDQSVIDVSVITLPQHPDSQQLIDYWKEHADRGGLQLGRHLPAARVSRLMSKIIVYEPVEGGRDFCIRLAGSGLLRRFGDDVSGKMLSQLYDGKSLEGYRDNLTKALTGGDVVAIDVRITKGPNQIFHMEYVFLPALSFDGKQTWVIAGVFHFSS